jgi:glycosyltransferase involved in cell wall biosynthesis
LIHSEHSKGGMAQEHAASDPQFRTTRRNAVLRRRDMSIARAADLMVFPSYGALQLYLHSYPSLVELRSKMRVIHNGIPELAWVRERKTQRRLVLNVAAHVPEKRIDRVVGAFGMFLEMLEEQQRSLYELVNFGRSGTSTTILQRSIRELGLNEEEILRGVLDRRLLLEKAAGAWACITAAEVAVFDLALLEWMALGRPIIASAVGGNREALGEDYPLFADDASTIAAKLHVLHSRPAFAHAVGERNVHRFRTRFTMDAHVRTMALAIEELLDSPTAGHTPMHSGR